MEPTMQRNPGKGKKQKRRTVWEKFEELRLWFDELENREITIRNPATGKIVRLAV